jgi:hypothetical protein
MKKRIGSFRIKGKRVFQKGIPKLDESISSVESLRQRFLDKTEEWAQLTGRNFFDTTTGGEADEVLAGLLILENTIQNAQPFVERMFRGGEIHSSRILNPLMNLLEELLSFICVDVERYRKVGQADRESIF